MFRLPAPKRIFAVATVLSVTLLAGCTIFAPPAAQPTATALPDQPPTRPVEATLTSAPTAAVNTPAPPADSPTATATRNPPTPTTRPPTATPTAAFEYSLQPGSPSYIPNIFKQELGCEWMGVGGQVFDRDGDPVQGVLIEIQGQLDGQAVLELSISGGATQYGAGGFEMTLANRPVASDDTLEAVLYDLQGQALSERIVFDTYDSCTANLILINFLASDFYQTRYYLPITGNQSNP